jgi:prevent-host-death family protein
MANYRRRSAFAEDAAAFRHDGAREVQASLAKTHFSQLLDEVERGATIVILRHGRPVARIIPDEDNRRSKVREAIENIKKLGREIREKHGPMTLEELLSLRHEGHKY